MNIQQVFSDYIGSIKNRAYKFLNIVVDGKPAFENIYLQDSGGSVIIIYGDNASGKSLFSGVLAQILNDKNFSRREIAMKNRASDKFGRMLIFGNESDRSTGVSSIRVIGNGFRTILGENNSALFLDEPDIGLAPRFQPALGQYIAENANKMTTHGLVLISHSSELIASFLSHYDGSVSYIGVKTDLDYSAWVRSQKNATVDELLALKTKEQNVWRELYE